MLECTGPKGQKERGFFENGPGAACMVAPGNDGIDAFDEILTWKGGMISEVRGAGSSPQTIDLDWQDSANGRRPRSMKHGERRRKAVP